MNQKNKTTRCLVKPDREFSTYDLGLAATLVTHGYSLWTLNKSNSKKVEFIFKRDESMDHTVQSYWRDELKVNPRVLLDNQKMLKNRIYSD
jgi:hypothetical protein